MKGSEERDLIFGKLFGYLAIIRSCRLLIDDESTQKLTMDILSRLLELHAKRGWIREVITESLLTLLSNVSNHVVKINIIEKLGDLITDPLQELTAWQLILCAGLKNYSILYPELSNEINEILPDSDIITAETLNIFEKTLLASTANFPKMHRVWDYILGEIVGFTNDRVLVKDRLTSLTSNQEKMLIAFSKFIDSSLLTSSHEKKSVAMRLSVKMIKLVPAEFIPLSLSKSLVKSLLSARINKKHTLHAIAGVTIRDLVSGVGNDSSCRLALSSAFVHYGSANFDSYTGITAVNSLLEGLGIKALTSHVKFLCGIIGIAYGEENDDENNNKLPNHTPNKNKKMKKVSINDGDSDEDIENESHIAAAQSAIEALASLAKNSKIAPNRAFVCSTTISVLVRVSCYGKGNTKEFVNILTKEKTPKKGSKKIKKETESTSDSGLLNATMIECIGLTENKSINNDKITAYPKIISDIASVKLLSLLADIGNNSLTQLDKSLNNGSNSIENRKKSHEKSPVVVDGSPTLLQIAMSTSEYLSSCNIPLVRDSEEFIAGEDSDDDEDNKGKYATVALKSAYDAIKQLKLFNDKHITSSSSSSSDQNLSIASSKLCESFSSLLSQASFHCLTSKDVGMNLLQDISSSSLDIVGKVASNSNGVVTSKIKITSDQGDDSDDSDSDDEDESAQCKIFDSCIDLLSVSGDHSVKGVRDASKKVWGSICQYCEISDELIETVIATIVGDDVEEDNNNRNNEDDDNDDEEEEEDDDDDEEEEDTKLVVKKDNRKRTKDEVSDDENEEDIMITEDNMMDMLAGDDSNSDDEGASGDGMQLQHTANADGALAHMIQLRKQSRKQGLLNAKRGQLLIRTRVIDILEVIIQKCDKSEQLLPMFLPLLICLRKVQSSTFTQSLQEGRAFEQRLRILISEKLNQKRFHLISEGNMEDDEGLLIQVELLLKENFKSLTSILLNTRQLALANILSISRSIISGDSLSCKELLSKQLVKAFENFSSKKNSRINPKLFDEMLTRFTDFSIPSLLPYITKSCNSGKTIFLRSESFRMLCSILRKHANLPSYIVIINSLTFITNAIIKGLTTSIGTESDNNKEKEMQTKRLKPVLLCSKELSLILKYQLTPAGIAASTVTIPETTSSKKSKSKADKLKPAEIKTFTDEKNLFLSTLNNIDSKNIFSSKNSNGLMQILKQTIAVITGESTDSINKKRKNNNTNTKEKEISKENIVNKSNKEEEKSWREIIENDDKKNKKVKKSKK
jgi:hypothetical protein